MEESSPQTFLSFNLRTVLVVVTVAALVTFVAAPYLRPLSAEQWTRLGKTFAATALGMLCWTFIAIWRERQIAARGGSKLLRLRQVQGTAVEYAMLLMLAAFLAMTIFFGYVAAHGKLPPAHSLMSYLNPFVWGMAISLAWMGNRTFKWATIYENGIGWGIHFSPWPKVQVNHFDRATGGLTLTANHIPLRFNISDDQWPTIESVLQKLS